MELGTRLYLGLLSAVALGRVLELKLSRRNQLRLAEAGSSQAAEPGYIWMVLFHSAVLIGCAFEVVKLERPLIPALAIPALGVFFAANGMRWWVIATLGSRWNTQIMSPSKLGIVAAGPYRWIRHPNYTAVFLEMLALPLIHTAWIVASVGAVVHLVILSRRVALEEQVMMQDRAYQAAFASKPRFIPNPWRTA
jgi:methyltransferase